MLNKINLVRLQDAHNAIADFDINSSLFAVYDGHGGPEVSAYCALKFPDYLKQVGAYQVGDFEKALKDAFIGFDATLLEENVIEELKTLAKKLPEGIEPEEESADEENLADLCTEAHMPLKDVLKKYEEYKPNPDTIRIQRQLAPDVLSSSKPISLFHKAIPESSSSQKCLLEKKSSPSSSIAGCSSSSLISASLNAGPSSSRRSLEADDTTVSSSSSKADEKKTVEGNEVCDGCSWAGSNGNKKQECDVPDSSSTTSHVIEIENEKKSFNIDSSEVTQSTTSVVKQYSGGDSGVSTNGYISGSDAEIKPVAHINLNSNEIEMESSSGVISSSSKNFENGEVVSSNTNNTEETKGGPSNNISSTEQPIADSSTEDSEDESYEGNIFL